MKARSDRLLQAYTGLMKLYPPRYRSEFAEERREVFALALEAALIRGKLAALRLLLSELYTFPASVMRAYGHEWENLMKTISTNLEEESLSWIGLLLGAWPFIFLGPLLAILPYLPRQVTRFYNFNSPLWLASAYLSLLIGILAGWRKGFPRWSYPYLVVLFFVIVIPPLGWLSSLLGPRRISPWVSISILLIAILGCWAVTLFLLNRMPATRKIYTDLRSDWTRLSFGILLYLAFGTGFYGGDHLPPLGLAVWLPSVLVVVGVVAYLFCRSRLLRSSVLIATLGCTILEKTVFQNNEPWNLWPVLLMVGLILSPGLLGLLPRRHLSQANEK